jgi:hypothetical protein
MVVVGAPAQPLNYRGTMSKQKTKLKVARSIKIDCDDDLGKIISILQDIHKKDPQSFLSAYAIADGYYEVDLQVGYADLETDQEFSERLRLEKKRELDLIKAQDKNKWQKLNDAKKQVCALKQKCNLPINENEFPEEIFGLKDSRYWLDEKMNPYLLEELETSHLKNIEKGFLEGKEFHGQSFKLNSIKNEILKRSKNIF